MKKNILIVILLLFSIVSFSQIKSYSPFSAFGIGDFAKNNLGSTAGMGGVSAGMQNNKQINFSNPASYIDVDSNDFVADYAVWMRQTKFEQGSKSSENFNFNFSHLAIKFPFTKWWATSIGIIPLTDTRFKGVSEHDVEGVEYQQYVITEGGIKQLYWGHAFKIDNFSIGFNASYLWGNIEHKVIYDFIYKGAFDNTIEQSFKVSDLHFNYGIQYVYDLNEKEKFVFGLSYEMKTDLETDYESINTRGTYRTGSEEFTIRDTISHKDSKKTITLPNKITAGFSYSYNNMWLLAADYTFRGKGNYNIIEQKSNSYDVKKTHSISVGAEYIPATYSKSYFDLINYRIGFSYVQSPYKITNGENIDDYTLSLGLGFPFPDTFNRMSSRTESKSMANIAFEIGQRGSTESNFIKETYFGVKINITLNSRWFYKRKYY